MITVKGTFNEVSLVKFNGAKHINMMYIVIVSTVYGDISNTLYIFTQMITRVTIYMLMDSMGESFIIRKSVVCKSHIGLIIYLYIVFSTEHNA